MAGNVRESLREPLDCTEIGMRRKRVVIGVLVCAGALALLLLIPPALILIEVTVGVLTGWASILAEEAYLQRPEVYEPIAPTLALYCQSDADLIPEYIGYAWFPEPLRAKARGWGRVSATQADLQMGGGFHHYGYVLLLDKSHSTETMNAWCLYFRSDGSEDRLLTTIELPVSSCLSADEIAARLTEAYDSRIAQCPKDGMARMGKILALLRYARIQEADQACRHWLKAAPDYWLPRFTHAHLQSRLGEGDQASADFAHWVDQHKNFSNYIYLALFNIREGRSQAALEAIRKALAQPFDNIYFGHNGAVIAFAQQDYSLCLQLCDKVLADPRQEPYWLREDWKLRAAAAAMTGRQDEALHAISKCLSYKREGYTEDDRRDAQLQGAIQRGDTDFIRKYSNWKDELDSLFTPYETDETQMLGRQDMPSPYPPDWERNLGF